MDSRRHSRTDLAHWDLPSAGEPTASSADLAAHAGAWEDLPFGYCPLHLVRTPSSWRNLRAPRFELELPATEEMRGAWRIFYLGQQKQLTQSALDIGVSTLALRFDVWMSRRARGLPIDSTALLRLHASCAPAQQRLLLDDVIRWTGSGTLLAFVSR